MRYGVIPTNLLERLALALGKVPVPVLDTVFSLIKARSVMAAVRLGVFETMRAGEHTASEIAEELALDEECLDMLLRTLVLTDYLEQRGERFALSKLAKRTMVARAETPLTGYLLWNYTQWGFFEHLEELVRTGRGLDFHDTLEDPTAWGHYQHGMLELARLDAQVVASKVPVPRGARRLLDVAGSHGLLGAAICRKHPPLRSTVIDLPRAIEHARVLAEDEGIAGLVEYRPGDVLRDEFGSQYDVVLLAKILHHFSPDRNLEILRKARRALANDGTVAVWEMERPKRASAVTVGDGVALFFRLTSTAGAYHGDEYKTWLEAAGFGRVRIQRPLISPGSVLVTGVG